MSKKIFSVILAVILVAGILSGCGAGKQQWIGKWYDDDGHCLDIRKDGTWQLDGLYGSGTWEYVDDHIELTDFYGEIDDCELCDDAYGSYIRYYGRRFYKGEYPDSELGDQSPEAISPQDQQSDVIEINVSSTYSDRISGNRVCFETDSGSYVGQVNSKGEIIHYAEDSYWLNYAGNNACYFYSGSGDKRVYTLVDKDGRKVELANDVFDEVIGFGDGLILVYKNNSTMTAVEHLYGVLDCNTGKWVTPLTAGRRLDTDWGKYKHIGNGVFIVEDYYGHRNHFIMFDAINNLTYQFDGCSMASDKIVNDVFWVKVDDGGSSPEVCAPYTSNEEKEMPDYFVMNSQGDYSETPAFAAACGNLYIDNTGKNLCIKDVFGDSCKEFTTYSSRSFTSVQFDGEHALMFLFGADMKDYFMVIDKDCNTTIEPTICQGATLSDGMIVYKNRNGIYEVQDANGNKLVSEEQGYTYISAYRDGIAAAKNSNGACFLGLDGNPLTLTLK